ncbi:branched-chain amino acid ABC transporter permease [Polynucleobacter brandtiae]|uniref:Amino acid/amide ABC transporter membrane protein 2 (HAAT family) n=1 Tax=Polynucleobacter brandtiae TaxID=1938816 RepID=A0A2M8VXW0_9BURK|nr:branched-chain amino acid ABC transporter permease [Polynucleobacter brandtiae]PJI82706.1 amino acid/amide ABC transporter membrane protein 2 (HAAT family) [Polynucleobacter brandtiae]
MKLLLTTFAVCLIYSNLLLGSENQIEVGALVVLAFVISIIGKKMGLMERLAAAVRQHPQFPAYASIAGVLITMVVFHDAHFALLMLATVLIYSIVCLGLNIQFGYVGIVNFAGAAFFGIGSYTAAVLAMHTNVPHIAILFLAAGISALIGCIVIYPVLRTRGHYAALVTIAFGILFRNFLEVNDTLGGPQGLKIPAFNLFGWNLSDGFDIGGFEFSFYIPYLLIALVLLIFSFKITRNLERSWVGLSMDMVRTDEIAASTFGVNIARWKIVAFTLGNFMAGMAGALYGMMTAYVAPNNFTFADSLILVSIVILGGIGNPWGIIPAAAIVVILPEKLQFIQEYRFLLYAIVVILILLFRPDGLLPRRIRAYFPDKNKSVGGSK